MTDAAEVVIGVDVSVRRGLDAVVLDQSSKVVEARSRLDVDEFGELIERWRPAAVAIDSPPGRGNLPGASMRSGERALRQVGINVFLTPSDADKFAGPFYEWVRVGMRAFEIAAAAGYPTQVDATVVRGRALEVFPHASDVFLRGCLPPAGTTRRVGTKRAWRHATLELAGVDTSTLCTNRTGMPTMDSIDAALAAVTARRAVDGDFRVFGDAAEWIVVPGQQAPKFTRKRAV